jgi:hypothetical protein
MYKVFLNLNLYVKVMVVLTTNSEIEDKTRTMSAKLVKMAKV